jgi:hypothetical protein
VSSPKDSIASSKSLESRKPAASSEFAYAALGHGAALHPAVEILLEGRDGSGNGLAIHYCAPEPIFATVAERKIPLTASFGPVGVPVLGREDFFAEFLVEINHRRRIVTLTPH